METRPHIAYEGFTPSDHIRRKVEQEAAKLERYFGRLTACRVAVRKSGGRRAHGDLFETRIHLTLPNGREVAATRNPSENHAHEDPLVAIRDAFHAARRQLQDEARKMRGDVKTLEGPPTGVVRELHRDRGYGFVDADDGREIYFHANSVVNHDFERLNVGDRVTFAESLGDKGPQASTLRPVAKNGNRT